MSFTHSIIGAMGSGEDYKVAEKETMTRIDELPAEYRQLIDGPAVVVLATRRRDGRPMLSPVWLRTAPDGERLELNTVKGRVKDRHLRRDPTVAIQIVNPENPYHWVTIYGEVDEIVEETDPERGHLATESIDSLAEVYVNQRPYPFRVEGEHRVLAYVRPGQIVTFGAP
jgi:PPOX class probable F420-dependent enzyme